MSQLMCSPARPLVGMLKRRSPPPPCATVSPATRFRFGPVSNRLTRFTGLAGICLLAITCGPGSARPDDVRANRPEVVSQTPAQVWKDAYDECWHTAFAPAPMQAAECEPNIEPAAPSPRSSAALSVVALARVSPAQVSSSQNAVVSADALFDFDKATLTAAGRATLEEFARQHRDSELETISVTGHADRLGSARYNQTLSENRAAAVKSFLAANGIDARRVIASGAGSTRPVTQPNDCPGVKGSGVVDCLQADRRVDIELVRTRVAQ